MYHCILSNSKLHSTLEETDIKFRLAAVMGVLRVLPPMNDWISPSALTVRMPEIMENLFTHSPLANGSGRKPAS